MTFNEELNQIEERLTRVTSMKENLDVKVRELEERLEAYKRYRRRLEHKTSVYEMARAYMLGIRILWNDGKPIPEIADNMGAETSRICYYHKRWDMKAN